MTVETATSCASVDAEFHRLLESPDSGLSTRARRHLAECGTCSSLYAFLSAPAAEIILPAGACDQAQTALLSSLRPVKPLPSIRILALQLFLAFLVVAFSVVGIMGPAGLQAMGWLQLIAMAAVLAGGGWILSLSLAWQMIPGSLHRVSAKAAVAILAAAFFAGAATLFPWHTPAGFFRLGVHCLGWGSLMAVPAVALLAMLVWRGAPLGRGTLGATLGALSGLLSVTVLQFTCSLQDAMHLITWHGGVLVVTTLVGAAIGRYGNIASQNILRNFSFWRPKQ